MLKLNFVTMTIFFVAGLEDEFYLHDDEDVYIAGQTEGAGPPQVIAEKLKELDEQTALDGQTLQDGCHSTCGT